MHRCRPSTSRARPKAIREEKKAIREEKNPCVRSWAAAAAGCETRRCCPSRTNQEAHCPRAAGHTSPCEVLRAAAAAARSWRARAGPAASETTRVAESPQPSAAGRSAYLRRKAWWIRVRQATAAAHCCLFQRVAAEAEPRSSGSRVSHCRGSCRFRCACLTLAIPCNPLERTGVTRSVGQHESARACQLQRIERASFREGCVGRGPTPRFGTHRSNTKMNGHADLRVHESAPVRSAAALRIR
jgi:hypothetical protein